MTLVWLLVGGAIGFLEAVTMWWTVARLRPGAPQRVVIWVVGGIVVRWGLDAGLLAVALQQGIVPGLLAFAGLWLSRRGVVFWVSVRHKSLSPSRY